MKTLEEFYMDCKPEEIFSPGFINWTHFRIFMGKRVKKIRNVIYSATQLLEELKKYAPDHVFYTPSKFMDPTKIGRKTNKISQNLFLFSDTFILDIDREGDIESAKLATKTILVYLGKMGWKPDYVCFSGSKGFHISLPFEFRSASDDPITREADTARVKTVILSQIKQDTGVEVDSIVSCDTRRIVRLPGTIHGKTGNLVEIIKPEDVMGYKPKNIVSIEKKEGVGDYI